MMRIGIRIWGTVQGVGFRPFVYTAATRRRLSGWVRNDTHGVRIEVEGEPAAVRDFLFELQTAAPSVARIDGLITEELPPRAESEFVIADSEREDLVRSCVPPDLATCAECLAEIHSPGSRRYRYPFTNCAHCGPRFTIIEALPYDRANTSMAKFPMCPACREEYQQPTDRRFHAQPIACPACGPKLRLLGCEGEELASGEEALPLAAQVLEQGLVLALKGLGGFQLLVDATNHAAVARLRQRKHRAEKPFAVLFPSLAAVRASCELGEEETQLLLSPAAPIVLVRRRPGSPVADAVAPNNPFIGALLPYTPLHHLLAEEVGRPLVCTSGNLSEEPMCIDDSEARVRLRGIADVYLVHDRPIVRPVDDSVARVGPTGPQVLRRARGYAPLPHPFVEAPCILALGGQLKSTVTFAAAGQAVVSSHIGDLFRAEAVQLLERTVDDFCRFLDTQPEVVACDLHPDYASTVLAERLADTWQVPLERVQHHHAHVAACVAEHRIEGPVLGLAWDGSGLGPDGTVWGGEALIVDGATFQRVAHLRPFRLPGGERAIRGPRRAALGLLYEAFGMRALDTVGPWFSPAERSVLERMLCSGLQSPRTTSVGRLFDAVSALAGVRARVSFEGQAAMELEWAAEQEKDPSAYPLPLGEGEPAMLDWQPLLEALLRDLQSGVAVATISARFHSALAEAAEAIAVRVSLPRVVLSGGCFQNLRLCREITQRLVARGFTVYLPQRFPPNDGALSLGQAYVAALRLRERRNDVPGNSR